MIIGVYRFRGNRNFQSYPEIPMVSISLGWSIDWHQIFSKLLTRELFLCGSLTSKIPQNREFWYLLRDLEALQTSRTMKYSQKSWNNLPITKNLLRMIIDWSDDLNDFLNPSRIILIRNWRLNISSKSFNFSLQNF